MAGSNRYSGVTKLRIYKLLRQGFTIDKIAQELEKPSASVKKHIIGNRRYYFDS
jgi:hypothetical protein